MDDQQQQNQPIDTSEHFDFQTFPNLNLLLANSKFYVGNNNIGQSQPQLAATQLQVSLLSRKRTSNSNQPIVNCLRNHASTTTTSITQPISIGGGLKLPSKTAGATQQQAANKHFLLPHWSSIMTSPHMNQGQQQQQQQQPGCSDNDVEQPNLTQTWVRYRNRDVCYFSIEIPIPYQLT